MAGQTGYNKVLGHTVRNLTLKIIEDALDKESPNYKNYNDEFRNALILRLAGTLLPRLNEHSGEDGGPITYKPIYNGESISKHHGDEKSIPDDQEDQSSSGRDVGV